MARTKKTEVEAKEAVVTENQETVPVVTESQETSDTSSAETTEDDEAGVPAESQPTVSEETEEVQKDDVFQNEQEFEATIEKAATEESSKVAPKELRNEVEGAKTKFNFFSRNQGREFKIDSDFVKIELFKRIKIRFYIDHNYEGNDFDYESIAKHASDMVHKAISGIGVFGIEVSTAKPRKMYHYDELYDCVSIFVPMMRSATKSINNIKSILNVLNSESKSIKYKMKIDSVSRINVDTSIEKKDCVFKGFAALSVSKPFVKEGEEPRDPKFFMRANTFIDRSCEFTERECFDISDVLSTNRIQVYGPNDKEHKFSYILPFKTKFSIVTFQMTGITKNGKIKLARTLNCIRVSHAKVANIVIPRGIYHSVSADVISVASFNKFFVDVKAAEKNTCALEYYCDAPTGSYEMSRFKTDCDTIDNTIITRFEAPAEE